MTQQLTAQVLCNSLRVTTVFRLPLTQKSFGGMFTSICHLCKSHVEKLNKRIWRDNKYYNIIYFILYQIQDDLHGLYVPDNSK